VKFRVFRALMPWFSSTKSVVQSLVKLRSRCAVKVVYNGQFVQVVPDNIMMTLSFLKRILLALDVIWHQSRFWIVPFRIGRPRLGQIEHDAD